jgi:IS30 family transposase
VARKRKAGTLWTKISPEVRRQIMCLSARGYTHRQIAAELDVSPGSCAIVLRPLGGVLRKYMLEVGTRALSMEERADLYALSLSGESIRSIAARLDRAPSTISRELARNGGRSGYRPVRAHKAALAASRRPKPCKLAANPALLAEVSAGLLKLWSPQQVSAHLRANFGHDETMCVSHETIYKSIYVQGRGELKRELARCLRSARTARKHQARIERRGKMPDMTMISERPAEANDRAVPGHWEGDLIMGRRSLSAIGTLVERTTRLVMLLHLGKDHSATAVRQAMTEKIRALPIELVRSLTWDQGKEMSEHAQFSIDTGVQVYFCDPRTPWMRGSNENTNGLLRQYFPKGTDLSKHTEADLDAAARSLNERPRQTLGWKTPAEKFNELLVATTA